MKINPEVAKPPRRICFSTRTVRCPLRAAATAAATPATPPPATTTSYSFRKANIIYPDQNSLVTRPKEEAFEAASSGGILFQGKRGERQPLLFPGRAGNCREHFPNIARDGHFYVAPPLGVLSLSPSEEKGALLTATGSSSASTGEDSDRRPGASAPRFPCQRGVSVCLGLARLLYLSRYSLGARP